MPHSDQRNRPSVAERAGELAARFDRWREARNRPGRPEPRWRAVARRLGQGLPRLIASVLAAMGVVAGAIWRGWLWLRPWQRVAAVVVLALAYLAPTAVDWIEIASNYVDAQLNRRPLLEARSWHYQLTDGKVDELARSTADLLVIDFAIEKGKVALTPEEVARLKVKPDGRPRPVVSYLSIGEAEVWRWYWRADWQDDDMPGWHVAENCAWPGGHMVRFWHDGWRDIVYRGKRSYLNRIIEAGFDGVYLDRVDVWEQLLDERPTARGDMIGFVTELAQTARRQRPGFMVIPQNAESLLTDQSYRTLIDGLGKEDMLFGHSGTGQRNREQDILWSQDRLALLLRIYKPVFAVEYLTTKPAIEAARREMVGRGLVPTFQHRNLDGSDPTDTALQRKTEVHGTPEWIAAQCKTRRWW